MEKLDYEIPKSSLNESSQNSNSDKVLKNFAWSNNSSKSSDIHKISLQHSI